MDIYDKNFISKEEGINKTNSKEEIQFKDESQLNEISNNLQKNENDNQRVI